MALGIAGLVSANTWAQSKTFVFRSVVQGLKPSIGLSVSPATVLFGTVALGQSASANIIITILGAPHSQRCNTPAAQTSPCRATAPLRWMQVKPVQNL